MLSRARGRDPSPAAAAAAPPAVPAGGGAGPSGGEAGQNLPGAARAPAGAGPSGRARGPLPRIARLPGLVREHRLFSVLLVLAVIPRAIAMLGYQPAILFKLDSYDYLWDATHLRPNPVNPGGYTLLLWLVRPFHSLALIAGLQHLLGLGAGVLVYAVLRRWGVRRWVATLAALPVLFDPAQILLEQLIMADLAALALMIAALAVLLLRPDPPAWRCALAGLLMGASAIVRPTALPLIVLLGLYLLVRKAGWRRAVAAVVAGALPVLGYMAWFAAAFGSFNMTNSNGLFLWSRTMSFANCAVIKPPADLRPLCPDQQPGFLAQPVAAKRPLPKLYLWDHQAWLWKGTRQSGLVPDTAAFTAARNQRALRFAIKAIEAQPLAYAGVVARQVAGPLLTKDQFLFPLAQPHASSLGPANRAYALAAVRGYVGSTKGIGPYLSHHLGSRLVEPYARLIRGYQRIVTLPGPVLAVIVAAGLAGILIPRRRSAAAALLWLSAAIAIVLPIAEHEYTYRYVIPAIPLACMAAALGFGARARRTVPAGPAAAAAPATAPGPASGDGPASRPGPASAPGAASAPGPASGPAPGPHSGGAARVDTESAGPGG